MKKLLLCLLGLVSPLSVAATMPDDLLIIQKPIVFDDKRKALTLQYMQERYGMMQDEPTIIPRLVVVHWTVIPTFEQTFAAFNPPELPAARDGIRAGGDLNVSSQFVIDRDGTIYQLMPETTMARHTIGLNYTAIGIENIADGDSLPMTDAQLDANTRLIRYLAAKYPIEYVLGHSEYHRFRDTSWWQETDANYFTEKNDPDIAFMNRLRNQLSDLSLKPLP
ncbi:N-acetylmuramoyl-L-alanine amidase [Arsukibacterium ikkense]|uniref:N-acetylmuramoyl-L-alanine amidase n=1 Tax=Arsukibacterium ikkense TaxID=336831 RepID=A0A0M2V4Q3_9GAMM|nr:peptidoglycan recognition family protein [Arsukibacterium ikkense]KKO45389.1 N-acetylmuramoyl-L-alanine amidase [Arsukibacterium ikkense]